MPSTPIAANPSIRSNPFSEIDQSKFGMWLFLGVEVLFFTAFLTTSLVLRFGSPMWPPVGTPHIPLFLPAMNTLVLLLSSGVLYYVSLLSNNSTGSHFRGLRPPRERGNNPPRENDAPSWSGTTGNFSDCGAGVPPARQQIRLIAGLAGALLLGLLFLSLQILQGVELYQRGFTLRANIFSNLFYTLIGIHWVHVAGGLLLLTILTTAALRRRSETIRWKILMQNTQMYWHFVDIVWLFLFILLYLT